ncbi:hypothetical protein NQ176_g938 [Zarea fungicola]|uniref:Uncharacterized protein n=1 Tax=Zarea fungicola TaxID=93591 RepID=A0ACC1NW58_9HYPO|nr:hypothetical protein NQ176_g938 [Lecanicillium fungicola]
MEPQFPPIQESLRASCDRCRAKKLACVISTPQKSRGAAQQCDRCIRARLTCVFSRRAQTGKGGNGARRTKRQHYKSNTPSQRVEMQCDPQEPTGTGRALISCELLPGSSMDLAAFDPSTGHLLQEELPSVDDDILHTYMSSLSKDEDMFLPPPPLANHSDMTSSSLTAESSCRTPFWGHGSAGLEDSFTDERSSFSQFLDVSVLVGEIHEQTLLLGRDTCILSFSNAQESVEKYPVGPVLRLTRRLAAELRHSWRPEASVQDSQEQLRPASSLSTSTYSACPESMDIFGMPRIQHAPPDAVDSKLNHAERPDLATNLLMLTGYAALTKLFTIVFRQIHSVLQRELESVSSSRHAQSHDLGEAALLQPGESSASTSSFEACSRVYTIVQMFLDELQTIEDIVSFPQLHDPEGSAFEQENSSVEATWQQQSLGPDLKVDISWLAREIKLVRAGLKQELCRTLGAGNRRECSSALQYGHHLKALLRERMGF